MMPSARQRRNKRMIVSKDKIKISAAEIIKLIVSVIFVIGIRTWFSVCPVMSEMTMSCHWAGEMLKAVSIVLLVISVIHIIIPDEKVKIGMDAASACFLIMSVFIPGTVIHICQDAQMRCRSIAQPWSVIISIVLLIACAADMIIYASAVSRAKHQRKDNA